MSAWKRLNEKERYGVAIDNFTAHPDWMRSEYLDLHVGEMVEMTHQYQKWYFGRRISRQTEVKGIFPKSYICIRECSIDNTGSLEVVSLVQAPIVQEITQTLRDWGRRWKHLYVSRGENFKLIEVSMLALLELRSAILTGTLPVDQLKKIERTAIFTIDKGNRTLGMDLIVRSLNGKLIDPLQVSACQLYNMHAETNNNVNTKSQDVSSNRLASASTNNTSSYSLFVSVRNFVCRMSEDAELLISLYDACTHAHFTEKYAIKWSKAGLASDIDQIDNMRVLFTDFGLNDIKREKVYLVCFVVRKGGMEVQNSDSRRNTLTSMVSSNSRGSSQAPQSSHMRRPFGVAAMDVTRPFSQDRPSAHDDDNLQFFVPFFPCDKDNLDTLLKRVITCKDLKPDSKIDQGLWLSLKLLNGDVKQFREEVPHLGVGSVLVARKMGFPEVILPGDARNDLYLSLLSGTFSKGGRSADMNIEVTVKVCNRYGQTIHGAISVGAGLPCTDEYNSLIYYHDNRPRWHEVFKICISIEEFRQAHVVFLFRHRSSNEAKDKSEKHFAMSYTPLMQPNGTTLYDSTHNLCVYKVDHKKCPASECEMALVYLSVPSTRDQHSANEKEARFQKGYLSLLHKDTFAIETKACSTKLTQNESLLGVLNWCSSKAEHSLRQSLEALQSVPGSEIVKFLPDTLDALFAIMTKTDTERSVDRDTFSGSFDSLVFKCVLQVIELVSDRNYHHFQPVLELYIRESFCATLAYKKLIETLCNLVQKGGDGESGLLLRAMKCLEYLLRFVVRSRQLHAKLTTSDTDKSFHRLLQGLLESMLTMMECESDAVLTSQGACIKYLPSAVPFLMEVFPSDQLSHMIGEILGVTNKLTKQRLMAMLDLVQGPLFQEPSCSCILLPYITCTLRTLIQSNDETHRSGVEMRSKNRSVAKIARVLGTSKRKLQEDRGCNEQLELCVKIMSEMLTLLFKRERGSTVEEFRQIAKTLLRTVLQATTQMDRDNELKCQLVAVLLEMLRQMTRSQYLSYMEQFLSSEEALDFVTDVQLVLKDLVEQPVFPEHWVDMIHLQNSVVLSTLKLFSVSLVEQFMSPFQESAWAAWFSLSVSFVSSPLLQLEQLTPNQRRRITSQYGDMRVDAALLITSMWANLGPNKNLFVPRLVEPFLCISLIPERKLRDATLPLFFDMMQCSYEANAAAGKGHFKEFENEIIHKLDVLVEGGQGDEQWRSLFVRIMGSACAESPSLKEAGCRLVAMVGRLLDTLLQYRASHDQASVEHRMQATTTLLDFYSEIERPEMYIRYVNKLFSLHLESESWAEAALTLRLHAKLLQWSAEPLQDRLRSPNHPQCQTHRHLKEALYYDMVHYLSEGKMWEISLEICRELVRQYEDEVFDYVAMPHLLRNIMSPLYEKILTQLRLQSEYFRVGYYGMGFPQILRNRVFVYRGKGCEKLEEFCNRIMNEVPKAELMSKLTPPTPEMLNSPHQYIQINAVEPLMCDRSNRMSGKPVSNQILSYYRYNNVRKFRYSRPFQKADEAMAGDSAQNEFSSLWLERTEIEISEKLPGILKWFPVINSRTFEMSPLEVAIETMTEANKALRTLVLEHQADDNISVEPLSRKLHGAVDAAVMGGITNYEKAFFTEEYLAAHHGHKQLVCLLKDLIAAQIPLLEFGVEVHRRRTASGSLAPFHQHIAERFQKMKEHVQTHYGIKSCDLEQEVATVTMRRQIQQSGSLMMNGADQRWSQISSHTDHSTDSGLGSRNTNSTLKQAFTQFNKQSNRSSMGSSTQGTSGCSSNVKSPVGTVVGAMLNMSPVQSPHRKRDKDKRRNNRKCESVNPVGTTSPPIATGSSQWYTSAGVGVPPAPRHTISHTPTTVAAPTPATPPVVELRQELTASRPLRSEVERERRLSQRPSSIQSCNSNRNSAGTSDSNASNEEEQPPPPLPQKNAKTDVSNKLDNITQLDNENNEIVRTSNETIVRDQDYSLVRISTDSACVVDGIISPILSRQNYDTVISPRGSFLYSSLQSNTVTNVRRTAVCLQDEKAPTPPPKKKNRSKQL